MAKGERKRAASPKVGATPRAPQSARTRLSPLAVMRRELKNMDSEGNEGSIPSVPKAVRQPYKQHLEELRQAKAQPAGCREGDRGGAERWW